VSHGEKPDTCRFGHTFEVYDRDQASHTPGNSEIRDKIKTGEIDSMEGVREELDGPPLLRRILGDAYKNLNVAANSQGTPYIVSWACADSFDEDMDYNVSKTNEDIFVAPQSNLHQEFMQRKQQAEQRLNQALGSLADRQEQKHMLEHDIRKLRSRAEAIDSRDEIQLKSDFVELVDGAGGGAQQGADEMPLKSLRDQNLYPSIVADFYEMRGLDDLKDPEDSEFENPRLNQVPANEKAILKKKWVMYEKWKDLYGSEVQRKLNDLKGQLQNLERSIDDIKNQLRPYVRDMSMINPEDRQLLEEGLEFYPTIQGTASMRRDIEFVCYYPLKRTEYDLEMTQDEDEATHYRVVVIHSVHVSLADGAQPNSPDGPSSATIFYFPAVVCEHVFENIFRDKINEKSDRLNSMLDDYIGEFDPSDSEGIKFKNARDQKNWSVRKLRKKVEEEVDEEVPIELSAVIRRVEDGLEEPEVIREDFGEDIFDEIVDLLDVDLETEHESEMMYEGFTKTWKELTGAKGDDPYSIPPEADPLDDLTEELKFSYYWDFKLGFGLYTMK